MNSQLASIACGYQQIFEGLLKDLKQENSPSLDQYRVDDRYTVYSPALLGVMPALSDTLKTLYRIWVTDLSHVGIGMLSEHDIPTEVDLVVNLEPLVKQACLLPIHIVYCQQLMSKTFRIGAVFSFNRLRS